MAEMTLYSYWRSSCSYRVRIALYLKEIPFEYRAVHLVRDGGEQHGEAYRRLNPLAEVPSLIHKGFTLSQSMAILRYLDRLQPEPRLFPGEPKQEARVIQLCEIVNAGTQPLQNSGVLKALGERYAQDMEGKIDWARHWMARGLRALETKVVETAGRFCVADQVTAVDLFLVPQLYNAYRFKMNMDGLPTLCRINETCLSLEAFRRAAPEGQPDAVAGP